VGGWGGGGVGGGGKRDKKDIAEVSQRLGRRKAGVIRIVDEKKIRARPPSIMSQKKNDRKTGNWMATRTIVIPRDCIPL